MPNCRLSDEYIYLINVLYIFQHLQKITNELDGEERRFEVITSRMQQYFCVREDGFKLQEFLQTLKQFCDQVKEVRKARIQSHCAFVSEGPAKH